jgi:hypothetical protein
MGHNLVIPGPSDTPTLPWVEASSTAPKQTWSVPSVVGWEGLRGFSGACWYTGASCLQHLPAYARILHLRKRIRAYVCIVR